MKRISRISISGLLVPDLLISGLLTIGLLSACSADHRPRVDADVVVPVDLSLGLIANAPTCRVGPDDGPVLADRGIGGTGGPIAALMDAKPSERVADRGIGGTGIVGVVTGFASICVNGLEVQYDGSAAVDVDGVAASVPALRAGQVVVIKASGTPAAPRALTISVRREVSGRIDAIDPVTGVLILAGQTVTVPAGTRGNVRVHVGDWVTVSGLHQADGVIVASRLDSAPSGKFVVHGPVAHHGDSVYVGTQVLQGPLAASLADGAFVTASGHYIAGQRQVDLIIIDTLLPDPSSYFGPSVNRIVIQAFVHVTNNMISFNGLDIPLSRELQGQPDPDGMAVVSLERRDDGSLMAVGLHYVDHRGFLTSLARIAAASIHHNPSGPKNQERSAVSADIQPVISLSTSIQPASGAAP